MSDTQARIHLDIDTSKSIIELQRLQNEVNRLNRTLSNLGPAASQDLNRYNQTLMQAANSSGLFQARMVPVITSVESFTNKLEKNKFTLGEYTKYAASQLPGLSRVFKDEFNTMQKVAEDRVRKIATQYVALGEAASGAQKAIALTPTGALNLKDANTQAAIAAQRHALLNKVLSDGSTKMLNWGKNTQWAGRQLMVGFSIPLAMLGTTAARTFKELDQASISFKRVYGDLDTTTAEMEKNLDAVKNLGKEYTKYGIAVKDTVDLGARVAATGAKNESLTAATEQTLRLATLGQMDYNTALDATISLQTAFKISNEDLKGSIDFLNAVENQTVLTLQDMAVAIPRVAPVIKGLGGDVKDLAVFMTAMREGGVSAEQGANALKSGLASLINPTKRAQETLAKFQINLNSIIATNRGDLMGVVTDFAKALSSLDEFSQQQALEQIFGKYQYARMGALFTNIINDSGQAARAMDLASESVQDLGKIADKELTKISEATSTKFAAAFEQLKLTLAPVGEQFMKVATPIIEFLSKLLDKFNNLPDGIKNFALIATTALAGIGPIILMTIGLMANGFANLTKGVLLVRKGFQRLTGSAKSVEHLAVAELEAATATSQLETKVGSLTSALMLQKNAVETLIGLYGTLASAASRAAKIMPTTMTGPAAGGKGRSQKPVTANKGLVTVPGMGNKDTVPALLTPGESVMTKAATQKYGPILQQMNSGKLPGYSTGIVNTLGMIRAGTRSVSQTVKNKLMQNAYEKEAAKIIASEDYKTSILNRSAQALNKRSETTGFGGLNWWKESESKYIQDVFSTSEAAHRQDTRIRLGGQSGVIKKLAIEKLLFTASRAENQGLNNIFTKRDKGFWQNIAQDNPNMKKLVENIYDQKYHPTSQEDIKALRSLLALGGRQAEKQKLNVPWFNHGWDIIVSNTLKERLPGGMLYKVAKQQASDKIYSVAELEKELKKYQASGLIPSIDKKEKMKVLKANRGFVPNAGKKFADIKTMWGMRHGATQSRNWIDPLGKKAQSMQRNASAFGPGVYMTNSDIGSSTYAGKNLMFGTQSGALASSKMYRPSRNPIALAKTKLISAEQVQRMGLGFDESSYKKLREAGYTGIYFSPQMAGQITGGGSMVVDIAAGSKWYNKPKLLNNITKNDMKTAQKQLEEEKIKMQKAQERAQSQTINPRSLNSGAVMLQNGLVPGSGNKDTVPALLTPGESVITKEATQKYAPILKEMNKGTLRGFNDGTIGAFRSELSHGVAPQVYMPKSPEYEAIMGQTRNQGFTGAEKIKGYTNWVYDLPRAFNKGFMSGNELEKMFKSTRAKNKIMRPIVRAIAQQMGIKPKELLKSSEGRKLIDTIAKNMGKELGALGGRMVDDRSFYDANQKAVSGALKSLPENEMAGKLGQATGRAMTQITTARAEFEGGKSISGRTGLSGTVQRMLGGQNPVTSYKGNKLFTPRTGWASRITGILNAERIQELTGRTRGGQTGAPRVSTPIVSINEENLTRRQLAERKLARAAQGISGVRGSYVAGRGGTRAPLPLAIEGARPRLAITAGPNPETLAIEEEQRLQRKAERQSSKEFKQRVKSLYGGPRGAMRSMSAFGQRHTGVFQGAGSLGMGLSMASMAPAMMANEQGQFMGMNAQNLSLGMMGGGTLLSMLPMFAGPQAGVMAGIAALTAAAAAGAFAIYKWRDSLDSAARSAAEFGANLGGAANAIQNISQIAGKESPLQRQKNLQLSVAPDQQEQFTQFAQAFEQGAGKEFIDSLTALTSSEKLRKVVDYIRAGIATGVFNEQEAETFAKAVGAKIGNQLLAVQAIAATKGQQTGAKATLALAQQREQEVLKNQGIQQALASNTPDSINSAAASMTISAGTQILKSYNEAIAMAEEDQRNGIITFQEYIDVVNQSKASIKKWNDGIINARKNTDDFGATAQGAETALRLAGIGEDQRKGIADAFAQIVQDTSAASKGSQMYMRGPNPNNPNGVFLGTEASFKKMEAAAIATKAGGGMQGVSAFGKTKEGFALAQQVAKESTVIKELMKGDALKNAMEVAIANSMPSETALGLVKQMLENPLGEAATAFKNGGLTAQAFADSLTAANAEIDLAAEGIPKALQKTYQNIAGSFATEGYKEAFRAFVAAAPNKGAAISQIQGIGKGMTTIGQQEARSTFLNTGDILRGKISDQLINTIRSSAAYKQALAATKNPINITEAKGGKVSRSTVAQFDPTKANAINKAVEQAAQSGVKETVITAVFAEKDANGNPINIVKRIAEVQSSTEKLNQLPQDVLIAFKIDTGDIKDIDKFGKMAQDIANLIPVLDTLPDTAREIAVHTIFTENGDIKDPITFAKDWKIISKSLEGLKSSKKNVKKAAIIELMQQVQNEEGKTIDAATAENAYKELVGVFGEETIMKLPPSYLTKILVLQVQIADIQNQINGLDKLDQYIKSLDAGKYAQAKEKLISAQNALIGQQAGFVAAGISQGTGNGAGGGGKKENPFKDLMNKIKEQFNLYSNFPSLMKQLKGRKDAFEKAVSQAEYKGSFIDRLRKQNLSESFIAELMSNGYKNAQKIYNELRKRGELQSKNKAFLKAGAMQTISDNIGVVTTQKRQQAMARNILSKGYSPQVAQNIAGDAQLMEQYRTLLFEANQAKGKKQKRIANQNLNDFLNSQAQIISGAKDLERAYDPLQTQIDDLTMSHRIVSGELDKQIQSYQDQIDAINEEIAAIEKLNSADQNRIRDLDRQKEMIQRQINDIERLNEKDQRKIESLRRQDEMRNRRADALSHELDIMSQQEQKIRDAYDERIKALDTIASINDHILNQQRGQLNLAQALSQGDVYAAAQAAQEMQAQQTQFATDQQRTALQQGMENQIAGLTTQGGLTRQEAEAQIAAIKEQSYQTSLQIRDIEDTIYQRNLDIIPLKEAQYNLDVQIQGIQDTIYGRETTILNIQTQQLDPLQQQLDKQQKIKNELDKKFEAQVNDLELQKDMRDMTESQRRAVLGLANQWRTVAEEIARANRVATQKIENLGAAPVRSTGESLEDFNTRLTQWQNKLNDIKKEQNNAINAATASGNSAMAATAAAPTNAGNFYGGIQTFKMATGGVVGTGGRDSVPSMLTPGEFVMRKAAVNKYGASTFEKMNMGAFNMPRNKATMNNINLNNTSMPKYNIKQNKQFSMSVPNSSSSASPPVYNTYSINVPVNQPNATADEIANKVMNKIRSIENINVRGYRG